MQVRSALLIKITYLIKMDAVEAGRNDKTDFLASVTGVWFIPDNRCIQIRYQKTRVNKDQLLKIFLK